MIHRFSAQTLGLALLFLSAGPGTLSAALPEPLKTDNIFLPVRQSTQGYVEVLEKAVWVPIQNISRNMPVGQFAPLLQKNQSYYVGLYSYDDGFTEIFAVPRVLPDGSGSAWTTRDNLMMFGATTPTSLGRFFLRPTEFLPVDSETPEEFVVTCERNGYTFKLKVPKTLPGTRKVRDLPGDLKYLVQLRDQHLESARDRRWNVTAEAKPPAPNTPTVLSPERPEDPDFINPYPEQVMAVRRPEAASGSPPVQASPDLASLDSASAPGNSAASPAPPAQAPKPRVVRRHVIESLTNDVMVQFQAPAPAPKASKAGTRRPPKPKPAPAATASPELEISRLPPTPAPTATASTTQVLARTETILAPPVAPPKPVEVAAVPAPAVVQKPQPAVAAEKAPDPNPFPAASESPPPPSVAAASKTAAPPRAPQDPPTSLASAPTANAGSPQVAAAGAPTGTALPQAASSSPWMALAVNVLIFVALLTAAFVVVVIVLALFLNRKKSKQAAKALPPSVPRSLAAEEPPATGVSSKDDAPSAAEPASEVLSNATEDEFANAPAEDSGTFTGSLESFSVAELIQFLYSSRETGVLCLDPPEESITSKLYMERGEIVDALSARHTGENAVRDILALREGLFAFTRQQEIQTQRTIKQSTMALLLEVQPDNTSEMIAAG